MPQLKVTASIKPWKKKFCITFEDFSWLWKYVVSHWDSNQIEKRRQKLSGRNQLATKCQKEDSQVSSVCPHSTPHTCCFMCSYSAFLHPQQFSIMTVAPLSTPKYSVCNEKIHVLLLWKVALSQYHLTTGIHRC